MTTPLISTILPTFEDWPFSDNVTPCAAGVGRGIRLREPDRIIQARAPARTSLHAAAATASRLLGRALAQPGGDAGALQGRRHTGGVVEVSDPRRDGGDHRHACTVAGPPGRYANMPFGCGERCTPRLAVDPEPRQPGVAQRAAQIGALGDDDPRRRLRTATLPTATPRARRGPRTPPPRPRSRRPGTPSGRAGAPAARAPQPRSRTRTGAVRRRAVSSAIAPTASSHAGHPARCASSTAQLEVGERAVEGLRAERPRPLALPRLSALQRHG